MICIYHSRDLDGWMSAAIVKYWFETVERPKFGGTTNIDNELVLIGWDYGQPIPEIVWGSDVIMVDISFPAEVMNNLFKDCKLVWIDHHISAINEVGTVIPMSALLGVRSTSFAACELTWQYFFPQDKIPELVRLLGRYDCFGHKNTKEELKVLQFQYGARESISNYEEAVYALRTNILVQNSWESIWKNGRAIYAYLCTEAKMIYKRAFPVTFDGFRFITVNTDRFNPINFGIDYHADGYDGAACFWYANGKWTFSLYNDNGQVDCSVICKKRGGGGHKGAAGFTTKILEDVLSQ